MCIHGVKNRPGPGGNKHLCVALLPLQAAPVPEAAGLLRFRHQFTSQRPAVSSLCKPSLRTVLVASSVCHTAGRGSWDKRLPGGGGGRGSFSNYTSPLRRGWVLRKRADSDSAGRGKAPHWAFLTGSQAMPRGPRTRQKIRAHRWTRQQRPRPPPASSSSAQRGWELLPQVTGAMSEITQVLGTAPGTQRGHNKRKLFVLLRKVTVFCRGPCWGDCFY